MPPPSRSGPPRELLTVMFTDIVDSTKRASAMGDRAWRSLLDRHDRMVRTALRRAGGTEIKHIGDGFVATFEAPLRAVECAAVVLAGAAKLGVELRAGIHTGEIERRGSDIGGVAVHIAARIVDLARPGEVLVSSTVKDLVQGSRTEFVARGTHALRGVSGRWRLFGVGHEARLSRARTSRPSPERTTALLADDHPLWRATLRKVLERGGKVRVVAEVSDGDEAVNAARDQRPDVVVMDMDMPGKHGIAATKVIAAELPDTRILVLSSSDERRQVVAAVKAGASGYLLKTAGPAEISQAVRRIRGGEMVFPPELAPVVLQAMRGGGSEGDRLEGLSQGEREVLALMAEGRSNAAIARRLHLSSKTVESRVASIFVKLGLEATAEDHRRVLAVRAWLEGAGPP